MVAGWSLCCLNLDQPRQQKKWYKEYLGISSDDHD